jgi:hypothetical protein
MTLYCAAHCGKKLGEVVLGPVRWGERWERAVLDVGATWVPGTGWLCESCAPGPGIPEAA